MSLKTGHHGGRVYVPGLEPVKRQGGWVVVGVLMAAAGCAAPPRGPAAVPHPLGVSYNVELLAAMGLPSPGTVMAEDFAHVRKLGFDTVLARHSLGSGWTMATRAARREGLTVAGSRREVLYYVRTGRLPDGCSSVADLVARGSRADPPGIVVLGEVVDAATGARARQVADAYRRRPDLPVTLAVLAGPNVEPSMVRPEATLTACSPKWAGKGWAGSVLLLECLQRDDETVPEASARWLGQYHAGLAAGLTGGVIVEQFRVVPGHWRGLVEGTDRSGLDRATVLRRITGRARRWGPRLRQVEPRDIRPLGPVSHSLHVVLFAGAKRRFVMLFNTSTEHFIRGIVDLPSDLDSRPVRRAVPVPADPNEIGGQVVQPRTGRLSMTMHLAPGDAALWELF